MSSSLKTIERSQDFFSIITNPVNIRQAYFDAVLKFDTDSKSGRYRGIDGTKMDTVDFISKDVLASVRDEIVNLSKISPAYMVTIPKKNGKKRKIYVYSLKERIKAEAIYRALLPFFDAYFSPYLFSYRSSHPSYYAARSAVRRYKRYYGSNYVLVADIADYADTIDHSILMKKLRKVGLDEKTLTLLELFIKTDTFEEGTLVERPRGVLTGTPLYALLSNFYMDEFDKWAGKRVALYRRVGDDIIAFDKDRRKIADVHAKLLQTVDKLKLKLNTDKVRLIPDSEEFKFLGYSFKRGRIGFDESSKERIVARWKQQLMRARRKSTGKKIQHVRSLAAKKNRSNNLSDQFAELLNQKMLVNDTAQVREISEHFFKLLTTLFADSASPKNRREARELMMKTNAPNFFKLYLDLHYRKNYAHSR